MGCCASQSKPDPRSPSNTTSSSKTLQLSWNTDHFQAKNFTIDEANIKLTSKKRMAHRIISKQAFPHSGRFQLRIRYASHKVSSYSVGVVHFGDQAQNQYKVRSKNVVRLQVSKNEGNFQSEGDNILCSKDWRVSQQDTIIMVVDVTNRQIEWKKQSNQDSQTQKTHFPASFANKTLYFQLIMHEPETQLNIQI